MSRRDRRPERHGGGPAYAFRALRPSQQNLEHMAMAFRQVSKPTYDDAARRQADLRASQTVGMSALESAASWQGHLTVSLMLRMTNRSICCCSLFWPAAAAAGWSATRPRLQRRHDAPGARGLDRDGARRVRDRRTRTTAAPTVEAEVLRDEVRGVGPLLATGRGPRLPRTPDWSWHSCVWWTCRCLMLI